MKKLEIAKKLCKNLGGFFKRHNVYIGGSLALELKYPLFKQFADSDIDIFVNASRIESWALHHIMQYLERIGVYVDMDSMLADYEEGVTYKIRNQWKRYKLNYYDKKGTTKIDVIFFDGGVNELLEDTAADISKFLYYYDYSENVRLLDNKYSSNAAERILKGLCFVDETQANDNHIIKIKNKCEIFGLEYVAK